MKKSTAKIGYLGPDTSTFGYQAVLKISAQEWGLCHQRPVPIDFPSHIAICQAVGGLRIKYGVVAVENVIDGVVAETVRAIESVASHLGIFVCGEVGVPVELFYMSKTGKETLPKRLISHQVAIGQCQTLVTELQSQGVSVEVRSSTGQAAKEAAEDATVAALASKTALSKYGLQLIRPESVVDNRNSITRFWVLGKQHARKTGKDKTCFLVNLERTESGVLYKTLGVFAKHGISVLLVYPSPILGKKWEYTFLIEVRGHIDDPQMDQAWHEFRSLGISLQPMRFLGSYPDTTS